MFDATRFEDRITNVSGAYKVDAKVMVPDSV